MSYLYEVTALSEFSAAHVIAGITGPCSRVHGHNFKLEVTVTCREIDSIGFSVDFYWLEKLIKEQVHDKIDHQFLNETPPFDKINPTCENIATWCFERIKSQLSAHKGLSIKKLSLWENSKFKITIIEDTND